MAQQILDIPLREVPAYLAERATAGAAKVADWTNKTVDATKRFAVEHKKELLIAAIVASIASAVLGLYMLSTSPLFIVKTVERHFWARGVWGNTAQASFGLGSKFLQGTALTAGSYYAGTTAHSHLVNA